jgi:Holliday junction resolvase RusA-like endonuclease
LLIIVKGAPIAKKRPRFARIGKGVRTYNAQETEEGRWLWEAGQQIKDTLGGPLKASFRFYMPIPKSTTKKARRAILDGENAHIKKPDLDNLVKFAKDCLNGAAWGDDSQVCEMVARKQYDEQPRTEIVIELA